MSATREALLADLGRLETLARELAELVRAGDLPGVEVLAGEVHAAVERLETVCEALAGAVDPVGLG